MKTIQERQRIQRLIRYTDDAFHRIMICLERLEAYLEIERLKGFKPSLRQTAIGTDRDLHNDVMIIPTRESMFVELAGQCMTLNIQASALAGTDEYEDTVRYFYKDLLEWYGGRNSSIPYNEIEAAVIPILSSLNNKGDNKNIKAVFESYVSKLPTIHDFSEEEQRNAVITSWRELVRIQEKVNSDIRALEQIGDDSYSLTCHNRGDALNGYKRIVSALIEILDDMVPAQVFVHTIRHYLPEITELCPTISESSIVKIKQGKQEPENDLHNNDDKVTPDFISSDFCQYSKDGILYLKQETLRHLDNDCGGFLYLKVDDCKELLQNGVSGVLDVNPPVFVCGKCGAIVKDAPSVTPADIGRVEIDGIVFYRLYCANPAEETSQSCFWKHGLECEGDMYIGSDGRVFCEKCGFTAPALSCKFSCNTQCIDGKFIVDHNHLAQVVAMSYPLVEKAGGQWLVDFLTSLVSLKGNICKEDSANNLLIPKS